MVKKDKERLKGERGRRREGRTAAWHNMIVQIER